MRTIVKGKNVEVPDRVRDYAERKLDRLERLLDDRTDAIVELSNEHAPERRRRPHRRGHAGHRRPDPAQPRGGVELPGGARRRSSTRSSARPSTTRRSRASGPGPRRRSRSCARIADGTPEPGREPRIVKTKRFAIEPMFEEDAVAAMEELGHQFFVFVNAETERVAILYARDDGDFGLIEPVVGGEYTPAHDRRRASTGRLARRAARPAARPRDTRRSRASSGRASTR